MKKRASGHIFVISGPSGSGKTTLAAKILQDPTLSKKLAKSISFTTRPKRAKEAQGRDYFFISNGEFKDNLRRKKILEWTKYLGYYYGTSRQLVEAFLKKGKSIILCLDLKGAKQAKQLYPRNTSTIFILPPSNQELLRRIKKRRRENCPLEIKKRLALAQNEIRSAKRYDYRLINADLKTVVKQLKGIILKEIKEGR